ncbi:MAG: hypothetical protein ABI180_19340 [Microcoleus sp.]
MTNCQLPIINYLITKFGFGRRGRSALAVFRLREYVKVMDTFYRAVDNSDRSFEITKTSWLLFVVSGDL